MVVETTVLPRPLLGILAPPGLPADGYQYSTRVFVDLWKVGGYRMPCGVRGGAAGSCLVGVWEMGMVGGQRWWAGFSFMQGLVAHS